MSTESTTAHATAADVEELRRDTGYSLSTPVETGIGRFVDWYRDFYGS